jgi:hypothetical protein
MCLPKNLASILAETLAGGYITHGAESTDSGVLPLSLIGCRLSDVGIVYGTGDAADACWQAAQHHFF